METNSQDNKKEVPNENPNLMSPQYVIYNH